MPRPPVLRAILSLALLLLAACTPRAQPIFGTGPNGERTIRLEVVNRNFGDATIYALRYGDRFRAGVVSGKGRATFPVRWSTPAPLRVEIRLLGGESCTTREVTVAPGDQVQIEVPQDVRSDPECVSR